MANEINQEEWKKLTELQKSSKYRYNITTYDPDSPSKIDIIPYPVDDKNELLQPDQIEAHIDQYDMPHPRCWHNLPARMFTVSSGHLAGRSMAKCGATITRQRCDYIVVYSALWDNYKNGYTGSLHLNRYNIHLPPPTPIAASKRKAREIDAEQEGAIVDQSHREWTGITLPPTPESEPRSREKKPRIRAPSPSPLPSVGPTRQPHLFTQGDNDAMAPNGGTQTQAPAKFETKRSRGSSSGMLIDRIHDMYLTRLLNGQTMTNKEFEIIFARCERCKNVGLSEYFGNHRCSEDVAD